MKQCLTFLIILIQQIGFSQAVTSDIFNRISETMRTFQIDTSAVPKDKLSDKITELRNLRGGFNINEAMEYKITEARSKNEISEGEYQTIKKFLTEGKGKRWIDNSITWIYRKHFTYDEIKQLVKFYKTAAGQKMANDFPVIMIQSVKSAEFILENYK